MAKTLETFIIGIMAIFTPSQANSLHNRTYQYCKRPSRQAHFNTVHISTPTAWRDGQYTIYSDTGVFLGIQNRETQEKWIFSQYQSCGGYAMMSVNAVSPSRYVQIWFVFRLAEKNPGLMENCSILGKNPVFGHSEGCIFPTLWLAIR